MAALERFYQGLENVVLRDSNNRPSIFVRHPKINSIAFDSTYLPDTVHPAFICGDSTYNAALIGKYRNSELVSGGTLYSLPNAVVTQATSISTHVTRTRAFGNNVTPFTIADHGLLLLMAHKHGQIQYGNTRYGADSRYTNWSSSGNVSVGTVRQFRGWLYTCISAHSSSTAKSPADRPDLWEKLEKVGGTCDPNYYYGGGKYGGSTYTGSGPIEWYLNGDPTMEADVVGNYPIFAAGARIVNAELQIIPNNKAADPTCDVSGTSTEWRAILPHANDSGCDMVTPGTDGTIKLGWINGKLTYAARTLTAEERPSGLKTGSFKNLAIEAATIPFTPTLLYELGLAPIPGTTITGDSVEATLTDGTFYAMCGGNFVYATADIGTIWFKSADGSLTNGTSVPISMTNS